MESTIDGLTKNAQRIFEELRVARFNEINDRCSSQSDTESMSDDLDLPEELSDDSSDIDIQPVSLDVEAMGKALVQSNCVPQEVYDAWVNCAVHVSRDKLQIWLADAAKLDLAAYYEALVKFISEGINNRDTAIAEYTVELMSRMSYKQLRAFHKDALLRVSHYKILWVIYIKCCKSTLFDWVIEYMCDNDVELPKTGHDLDNVWEYIETIGYSKEIVWLLDEIICGLKVQAPIAIVRTISKFPLPTHAALRTFGRNSCYDLMMIDKAVRASINEITTESCDVLQMVIAYYGLVKVARHPRYAEVVSRIRTEVLVSGAAPNLRVGMLRALGETIVLGDASTINVFTEFLKLSDRPKLSRVEAKLMKEAATIWLHLLERRPQMHALTTVRTAHYFVGHRLRGFLKKRLQAADRSKCDALWGRLEDLLYAQNSTFSLSDLFALVPRNSSRSHGVMKLNLALHKTRLRTSRTRDGNSSSITAVLGPKSKWPGPQSF